MQQLRLQHKSGASLGSSPPRTAGFAPAQRDLRSLKRAERLALIPGVLASRFPADQLALVQVGLCITVKLANASQAALLPRAAANAQGPQVGVFACLLSVARAASVANLAIEDFM